MCSPNDQQPQSSTQITGGINEVGNSYDQRKITTVSQVQTKHIFHDLQQAQSVTIYRESAAANSSGKQTITPTRDTVTHTAGIYNL